MKCQDCKFFDPVKWHTGRCDVLSVSVNGESDCLIKEDFFQSETFRLLRGRDKRYLSTRLRFQFNPNKEDMIDILKDEIEDLGNNIESLQKNLAKRREMLYDLEGDENGLE